MTILHINKFYFAKGGAESYLFELERRQRQAGHVVAVFAMAHPENQPTDNDRFFPAYVNFQNNSPVNLLRKFGRMIYSRSARRGLRQLLATVKPDVAHVHNIYHHLSPSILLELKRQGIPVVMTVHDYKLVTPNYIFWRPDGTFCRHGLKGNYWGCVKERCVNGSRLASLAAAIEMTVHKKLRLYERLVDRFIAPSQFVKHVLVEYGFPEKKIVVIPHGIDSTVITPVYRSEPRVLFIGRLMAFKGVQTFVNTAALLPEVAFDIVGDGPERARLEAFARQAGLTNITWHGDLRGTERENVLTAARVVIVPSEVHETFGLTALEAMAHGKAVIATNRGGLGEIIDHGHTGCQVSAGDARGLADAIQILMADPHQAHLYGQAGRAKAEAVYSLDQHERAIMTLYASLA